MSLNEITGDQLCSKFGGSEAKKNFDEGFDRIFGKGKIMTTNYQETLKQAVQAKQTAELRLQAAHLNHSAACLEQNDDLEAQLRAQIHALSDIVLDNSSIVFLCIKELAGKS